MMMDGFVTSKIGREHQKTIYGTRAGNLRLALKVFPES